MPPALNSWPVWLVITAHIVVAVIYTTPWDNYLVATSVWWYDPELVAGLIIGWVPIEEYLFFILQTLMTSLWLVWLAKRMRMPSAPFNPSTPSAQRARWGFTLLFALLWIGSLVLLISGWRPGTYLALELTWALLPILLQVVFGGDILWRYRNLAIIFFLVTNMLVVFGTILVLAQESQARAPQAVLNFLHRFVAAPQPQPATLEG